jgi:hypothetical protein
MRDDSTLIGSCQDADGNAERAPADGDNAQRGSPCDRAPADGGSEHPEEVLPNVTREEDVNAEIETAAGDVREVVEEAENNVGVDQQVQHLSHFLFISVISFFYLSHFLHYPSIRFLEAVLSTLELNPVC